MISRIWTPPTHKPPKGPLSNRLIQTSDEPYTPNACYMPSSLFPKSQTHGRNIHTQNQPSAQTVESSTMFNDVRDVKLPVYETLQCFCSPLYKPTVASREQ